MDIYIARQPIFDRDMNVYGYELLYRQSSLNQFTGVDDDQATSELIYNSFLVVGLEDLTDGAVAFINFSKGLIESDVPFMLPEKNVVVEVLERDEATEKTIDACRRIRSRGYTLALDDFIFDRDCLPLVDFADIIKVEFPALKYEEQRKFINRYRKKVKFLAEKIETREEFHQAVRLGYDYFQGYFFSKPSMINAREIVSLNVNLFKVMEELNRPEPSIDVISDIIRLDLGLAFKLLKLANSVYIGAKNEIRSIQQALTFIGIKEIHEWITLIFIKDLQNVENAELIKLSLVRGKLMELIAGELHPGSPNPEYFFTGLFSFIDILLGKGMSDILEGLPLPDGVKKALLGEENEQRQMLDAIAACESSDWQKVEDSEPVNRISPHRYMELYIDALKWVSRINY